MDLTPILSQIFENILYVAPCVIVVILFKSPWFKGFIGECVVNLSAKLFLDKKKYHLIKNVTLPTEDGSTQIDHVIVSKFGVFVVETKNMKGWIFGSPSQKTWTQKIYRHSNKFQNPLHQNYQHTKTLESLLKLNEDQIFSVVVFVGSSKFKTEMPENVTYGKGCIRYIKSKNQPVLTESEVKDIINKVETDRLKPSFKTNREHVRHVKTIVSNKANIQLCPKCGNTMVLRKVKKGQNIGNKFWGCSGFPKCRGVVNITS